MEAFTLNRNFHKQDVIDGSLSHIWTERYFGDSVTEIVVPATTEMIEKLPEGIFLGIDDSDEIMILETATIEDRKLKLSGISLLSWMNNRFVRTTLAPEDRYWNLAGYPAGWTLWQILYYMCVGSSPFLNGTIDTGIDSPGDLAIPGLDLLGADMSGPNISVGVPYKPVYEAMREIAVTYQIGLRLTLEAVTDSSYFLGFRSYQGLDRTSEQTDRPTVRFSPEMDSLTNIKELRSIAALKTRVYAFAPRNPEGLTPDPGVATSAGAGFDLRALQLFVDDITTTEPADTDPATLLAILTSRANDALKANAYIQAVDGEIVPDNQFKYGKDYNLGDIVEVQGYSGTINSARVTEYIRSKDSAGEKAYPTIEVIG